jgi:hypothetical protein
MRLISLLVAGGALASCTNGPPVPTIRTAENEHALQMLVAGKVAQQPLSCLPHYRSEDMRVIDEETVAFRDGSRRTYVGHLAGGCNHLGSPGFAMVTRKVGSADLCRGDIARIVDTQNGFTVGSCVFGDFVPYVAPGA